MIKAKFLFFFIICMLLFPTISSASVIHVIHNGESLWSISKEYGTSSEVITKINGLENQEKIIPGQSLVLPGKKYIVQPGESLWEIAKRHAVSLGEVKSLNGLQTNVVQPGQELTIPTNSKEDTFIGAFFIPKDEQSNKYLLGKYQNILTSVGFFEYHPDEQGNLSTLHGESAITTVWNKGMIPYATVTNLSSKGFDDQLAHKVIGNQTVRKQLINNIFSVLHKNELKGVIIDFEGLQTKDRQHFNTFIKELAAKLHPVDMKISIALPPMQGDRYPAYHAAYDYKTLGTYADSLFLMTYDWHWAGGPAGPIAPIGEIKETVEYAISVVPKSKIVLGVPMYAYDWTLHENSENARAYSQQHAINVAVKHGSVIHYNNETDQPYFMYKDANGVQHEVWFEDARSILAKYRLIKKYDIAGMGGWKLGLSFPQAEHLLKEEFLIK
ncbi:LysM peptidoglycan-binding domain-containing protein [Pontibacillus yanchengensis]|uniref:LysM peptidoglycan-binding domain-containing protein n=1 Tax=Pontibacillus yanchengensis TaxID=462910 RepID=A0ACC7VHR6_9BACI|nr:glycosyl hydrolase family 18 protein [Pontibacillus yanchengensis]MYL55003.1 LysM peptidoglycan-binding domain-containing protein [Pontibacillus yanchengensis]